MSSRPAERHCAWFRKIRSRAIEISGSTSREYSKIFLRNSAKAGFAHLVHLLATEMQSLIVRFVADAKLCEAIQMPLSFHVWVVQTGSISSVSIFGRYLWDVRDYCVENMIRAAHNLLSSRAVQVRNFSEKSGGRFYEPP
jgi:hypothetical protein